jgi:hypothetical protein
VNVRDHTTTSNSSLDESVELLITSNSELEVSGCDSFHLKILAGVSGELEDLSCQVLEDSCSVDGRSGSNSAVSANSTLQESVNSSNGELKIDRLTITFVTSYALPNTWIMRDYGQIQQDSCNLKNTLCISEVSRCMNRKIFGKR